MAALNQTYITTHGVVEKGTIYETKFLKALDQLKKSKKLRKKLTEEVEAANEAKATLEDELAKLKTKNMELQNQLQGSQEDHQTFQLNYANVCGKVMGLEKQVKAVEDRLCEAASREAVVLEAKQWAIDEFKQSE